MDGNNFTYTCVNMQILQLEENIREGKFCVWRRGARPMALWRGPVLLVTCLYVNEYLSDDLYWAYGALFSLGRILNIRLTSVEGSLKKVDHIT